MTSAQGRAQSRNEGPTEAGQRPPPLVRDLGVIARLYGDVFWMIGQRLQHGRDWEEKLARHALMLEEEAARKEASQGRHN